MKIIPKPGNEGNVCTIHFCCKEIVKDMMDGKIGVRYDNRKFITLHKEIINYCPYCGYEIEFNQEYENG